MILPSHANPAEATINHASRRYLLNLAFVLTAVVLTAGLASCRRQQKLQWGRPINAVCLSPDGKLLASGGRDQKISVWDVALHRGELRCWSPTAKPSRIWFSVRMGVHLLLLARFPPRSRCGIASHSSRRRVSGSTPRRLRQIAYSPDGKVLAAASGNRITLLDPATGENLRMLEGPRDLATSVAFSPDGCLVASGSFDTKVRIWDVTSGKNIAVLDGDCAIDAVAFATDARTLASGDEKGMITFWDVRGASKIATVSAQRGEQPYQLPGVCRWQISVWRRRQLYQTLGLCDATGATRVTRSYDGRIVLVVPIRRAKTGVGELRRESHAVGHCYRYGDSDLLRQRRAEVVPGRRGPLAERVGSHLR